MNASSAFSPIDPEEIFEAFERAWQAGTPRSIEDCLRATPIPHAKLLKDLVQMDLEYRLKARHQVRVEDYLERFPELSDDPAKLLELLEAECRHRVEFGQPPAHNEYFDRFPSLRDHLLGTSLGGIAGSAKSDGLSKSWLPQMVGRYKVIRPINEGGMSEIIRLQDDDFQRPLAMKAPKPEYHRDHGARVRFLREARITGRLQHPGIPPVFEMGVLPDGRPHFIMKLIEGESLKELLAARQTLDEGPMYFLGIFDQVCQTVAYAHTHSIIHRDLKPDNVMVGPFGEVQVMDWGLAKELDAGFDDATTQGHDVAGRAWAPGKPETLDQTRTGTELGTPAYMAPEQARGRVEQIDRRSDVFGLGGMLCEIMTGKPPFETSQQSRDGELSGAYARLDACGADDELIALAKRCMAVDAKDRPANAGAVAKSMAVYRELVRDRLRQAEVAKGQAEVKAMEERIRLSVERQKRRATVALAGVVIVAILAAASGGWWTLTQRAEQQHEAEVRRLATQAAGLAHVHRVLSAETSDVPAMIGQLKDYREWADPLLRRQFETARPDSRLKLHAGLALLPTDTPPIAYLYNRLLDAEPHEVVVIRDQLVPHKDELIDKLWAAVLAQDKEAKPRQFRSAAALAKYDPENEKWGVAHVTAANELVSAPAPRLAWWVDSLRPVRVRLLPQLISVFRDPSRPDAERMRATEILADYASDDPKFLADALMDANEKQFAVIFPKLKPYVGHVLPMLSGELDRKVAADIPSADGRRETLAKRQANAAVALLRFNQPEKVWPLLKRLKMPDDPRLRSYLIHRLGPLGADSAAIIERLRKEPEITLRRALVLCLGEFSDQALPLEARQLLLPELKNIYCDEPDPGMHAAAEWLLRTWNQTAWLDQTIAEWAADAQHQRKRVQEIQQQVALKRDKTPMQWYVNTQSQTMVVVTEPAEFLMGSPLTERGRDADELPHRHIIPRRTYALSAAPVTVLQFSQFDKRELLSPRYRRSPDMPMTFVDCDMAAQFCNWLSRREGLEESYAPDGDRLTLKYGALQKDGYRLPTEAELEYATRAEAMTSRFYGETEELLPKYAWTHANSQHQAWPVGSLRPNDMGFFDMHGNVSSWSLNSYRPYKNETMKDVNPTLAFTLFEPRAPWRLVFRPAEGCAFRRATKSRADGEIAHDWFPGCADDFKWNATTKKNPGRRVKQAIAASSTSPAIPTG